MLGSSLTSYDVATAEDWRVGDQFHVAQGGSVAATIAVRLVPKDGYPCLAPAITLVLTKRSPPVDQIRRPAILTEGREED